MVLWWMEVQSEKTTIYRIMRALHRTSAYKYDKWLVSNIFSTEAGRLMARYCIAYETMKKFCGVAGTENINDLVGMMLLLLQRYQLKDI